MKVNITGMLRGAWKSIDPALDRGSYAYMLEELIGHVEDVRAGRHTLAEFADFYCMTPAPPATLEHTAAAAAEGGMDRG